METVENYSVTNGHDGGSVPNSGEHIVLRQTSIFPDPANPRKRFDPEALEELAASIREHGLLQPIVVRPHRQAGSWLIIAGERRWRACGLAGVTEIPAIVRRDVDDHMALRIMLIENLARQDLDPLELAEGYRQLNRVVGMKQREIAEAVHRSQPAVANAMRLLELPEDVKQHIREGKLTPAHGVALAAYKDFPNLASTLARIAVREHWTSRQLETDPQGIYDREFVDQIRQIHNQDLTPECPQCPRGAYRRRERDYYAVCLKPECFDEKKAQLKRAAEAKAQAIIAEAQTAGTTILRTRDLNDAYVQLYAGNVPPGCESGCPHNVTALANGDVPVQVCTDPKCHRRLTMADGRAKKKAHLAACDRAEQRLRAAIDALPDDTIPVREFLFLVGLALDNHGSMSATEALQRRCSNPTRLPSSWHDLGWPEKYAKLAALPPGLIVKAVIEGVLLQEITADRNNNSYSGWTKAYLGPEEGQA